MKPQIINPKYILSLLIVFFIHTQSFAEVVPVAERTSQIRDAIVAAAGVTSANDVTDAHLALITNLNLRSAGITELNSGDFSGITGLTNLNLHGNELRNLPDGIFKGLTALTTLRLGRNAVDPFPITVSLEKVDDDKFKVIVPTGAPFDIVVTISATNGSIADSATSLTVARGSTESSAITVSRTADTTDAVTVNIGTLPGLPWNNYGYVLTKSDALPLEVISAVTITPPVEASTNTAPVFTDGSTAIRSIAENTTAGVNIGTAVPATDANEDDTLTYTLGGVDAASFDFDSTTGQLKTKASLDYETKSVYLVTITVSDGSLTDTITVIISVFDVDDTPLVSTSLPVNERTPQVRDAIVAAIPDVDAADDVTETHLATISRLYLRNTGISELKTGDFSGLTGLTNLNLYNNVLRTLPVSIFDGLTSLSQLRLEGNLIEPLSLIVSLQQVEVNQFQAIVHTGAPFNIVLPIEVTNGSINDGATTITIPKGSVKSATFTVVSTAGASSSLSVNIGRLPTLPMYHYGYFLTKSAVCNRTPQVADAIAAAVPGADDCHNVTEVDLAIITSLDLSNSSITSLNSDDFSGMLSLTTLSLNDNQLTDLPSAIFDGLSLLTTLNLSNNQLTGLPNGIFKGLESLQELNLSGNTVDPLPLTVSLQQVGEDGFKVVAPTAAPFDIILPISVVNGSIENGVSTVSIPTGSIESQPFVVTRTPDTNAAVTVDFGNLPNLPSRHSGYVLVKSNQEPLEILSSVDAAPVFTEGVETTRSVPETTEVGVNIGNVIAATDADGDTLTYSLGGTDADAFSIDSGSGQLKTNATLDYETKNVYTVTVMVSDDNGRADTITVTINIIHEDESTTPVFTEGANTTRTVVENTDSGVNIGTPVSATDADGDTLTYSLGGTDADAFDIERTTGQLKTKAALDYETKSAYAVKITVSDGSLTASIDVTINVTDIDDTAGPIDNINAPVFTEDSSTTRIIAENTESGVNIGIPISATDVNEDTLIYSIGGTDAASFSINSGSGQLKTNATLDYEAKNTYTVTITVSDGTLTDTIEVTINLTNVNDPPVFTEGESTFRAVAEEATVGENAGTAISATDADGDTLTYSLRGTDAASFTIDRNTGQLQVNTLLDFETKPSYSVTVNVSDRNGGTSSINVTINIRDVAENRAPEFIGNVNTTITVDEGTASGENIGAAISATDEDADPLAYSLGGSDAASFSIVSTTGQFQTKASLNYETKNTYSVTVTVTDDALSTSIEVTINVNDINESPMFTEGESTLRSVVEDTPAGQNIGSAVSATDIDQDDTLEYSLGGTDADSFAIDSANGQLQTKTTPDYETKDTYTVVITVSDGDFTDTIQVTINISDINDAPIFTDGDSTTRSIPEKIGPDQPIGSVVSAIDADGDTIEYILSGIDADSFSIDSENGQLKTNATLNYETKDTYTVMIIVFDGELTDTIQVTINILNANDAPIFTDGDSTTRSTPEHADPEHPVGSVVTATDIDGDTLEYSISGTHADLFSVDSSSGQMKTVGQPDFEADDVYSVTITVSDGELTDTIQVTILISNVNDPPSFTEGSGTIRNIDENSSSGVAVGNPISATDIDSSTLAYSLSGQDVASFSIDNENGQLKTKAALNYEVNNLYAVVVTVSDGELSDTIVVRIHINDVNEAPVFQEDSVTRSVPENTESNVPFDNPITASDVDANTTLIYSLEGSDAEVFGINSGTGQLQTNGPLNFEATEFYLLNVIVSDGELSDTIELRIDVEDINDAPVFEEGEDTTRTIDENTVDGQDIDDPVGATDEDNDTLTYTLVDGTVDGTDASAFSIDTATGQLQTKEPLDHETQDSYEVTINVSDGNITVSIDVTIEISDVNEAPVFVFDPNTDPMPSIAENTGSGTNIGSAFTATDVDGDTLTYTLVDGTVDGTDASAFSIDTGSGQLQTKKPLDHETQDSYEVTINVSDGNITVSIDVTIEISDVNEAPVFVFDPNTDPMPSIAENTGSGTNIGSAFTATDVDEDTLTYTLVDGTVDGTDASAFSFDTSSGQLQTFAPLDHETQDSYEVTITVTDGNLTASIGVTIDIIDVNEAPVFSDNKPTARSIAENTSSGMPIDAPVEATDIDDGDTDTLNYTLGGTDARFFGIVNDSGQLQTHAALNYEIQNSYEVTINVSDGSLNDMITVTINVTDVNDAPVFTEGLTTTRSIAENTSTSVPIGAPMEATDVDRDNGTPDTLVYTLVDGTDARAFSFDTSSGQITTNALLDHETQDSYEVTINVSDGNITVSIDVTIEISDVNEAPVFVFDPNTDPMPSIAENTGSGIPIGDPVEATDVDRDMNGTPDTLVYTLVDGTVDGTDASAFSIDTGSGQLQTKKPLDHETQDSYSVTITVSDGDITVSIDVMIRVTDVNDAPTFPTDMVTEFSIAENSGSGTHIGDPVEATDVDRDDITSDPDTLAYTLGGEDADTFDIDTSSGQLKTKNPLNYEITKKSYTVIVTVSDGKSPALTDTIEVTITVTNVNDAPVFDPNRVTLSIEENTVPETNIGSAFTATDDDNHPLTYSLGGTDAGWFDFDTNSRQLKTLGALDFEDPDQNSYTVTVIAHDGQSPALTGTVTVTITVTNVNDAPVFPTNAETMLSIEENTASGTNIGDAFTATDDDNDTLTYILALPDAGAFDIDTSSGQLKTKNPLNFEDKSSYTVAVIAHDGQSPALTDTVIVTINVANVNEAPVFTEGTTATRTVAVAELVVGTAIGDAISATDEDEDVNGDQRDTLAYAVGGTNGALFGIVTTTGQLQATQDLIDDAGTGYVVTVTASDGFTGTDGTSTPATASVDVTITVTRAGHQATNNVPVFNEGSSTSRSVVEGTASGRNIGDPVIATDVDNDTLTYGLIGTDANSFSIITNSGQLQTKDALDHDTKSSYSVSVTVTDSRGGNLTITVTINVTETNALTVPVQDRTVGVQKAIQKSLRRDHGYTGIEPNEMTVEHLAKITTLALANPEHSSVLASGDFADLPNLAILKLIGTNSFNPGLNIASLPSDIFDGLTSLTEIDLEGNLLTSLDVDLFDGLTALTTLNLVDNSISSLPEDVFDGLTAMTDLDLSENSISSLPEDVFNGLSSLEDLDLSENSISSLPEDVFNGLSSLEDLDLNENSISSLPEDIFDGLSSIEGLDLSKNMQLSSVPSEVFDGLTSLLSLSLAYTSLTTLPSDVFKDLTALKNLSINFSTNDSLTNLPSGVFDGLSNLLTLNLNENGIVSLPSDIFSDLSSLLSLNLSDNLFTSLPSDIFKGLTSLGTLRISGNPTTLLPITVSLIKVAEWQFKASTDTGAPYKIRVNVTVENGEMQDSNAKIFIQPGTVDSETFAVTRTTGTTAAVTVTIDTFNNLPSRHSGYKLVKPSNPTLEVISTAVVGAPSSTLMLPEVTALLPNYPNPFNPETWIPYQLSKSVDVTFTIYNMRGVIVRELALGHKSAGYYTSKNRAAYWNGRNNFGEKVAAGVYFSTLKAGDYTATRKLLIRK